MAASLIPLLSHSPLIKAEKPTAIDALPNVFPHDLDDYRNVVIAEGLDQLDKKLEKGISVGAIYGAAHGPEVKDYISSPVKREAQLALYADYKNTAKPHARIFEYKDNVWTQISGWDL